MSDQPCATLRYFVNRHLTAMIPNFQEIMRPLLEHLSDDAEHQIQEIISAMEAEFGLTDEERNQLLPSGRDKKFSNRVRWATFHLTKALLVESTRRGVYRLTHRGKKALESEQNAINIKFLEGFEEYRAFRNIKHSVDPTPTADRSDSIEEKTPEDLIEEGYERIRQKLIDELLRAIKTCTPSFFENLVVELLVAMGYGGSKADVQRSIGHSGDEGIDGIIKEDKLGLDAVYIQAKRWGSVVPRPEIQKFAGALQGQRARKGVFITTSEFTSGAQEFVKNIDSRIVLIDGLTLGGYMIDYDVGVSREAIYEIKKLDTDYFNEG